MFLFAGALVLAAQTGLPPSSILLARIKVRAAENLSRLPNYTCLETIERSQRLVSTRKFELLDVLRFEVAVVNSKEMYAWPGSQGFEDKDITDMVSGGSIGNGSFATHARSVFMTQGPIFTPVGEETLDGTQAVRYDYRVPMFLSGYKLRMKPLEGTVGYKGSFWANAKTLDLMRLDVIIDDIPPHIPLRSGKEVLEYARQKIGERDFLLPHNSEMVLVDLQGNEHRNRIRFTGCREYAIESIISFADVPDRPIESKQPPRQIAIPHAIDVDLKIDTPIEAGVTAVGDTITATVVRDVKRKGVMIIPKGAKATGRVLRMQRARGARTVEWAMEIAMLRIEFDNQFADFTGHLNPMVAGPYLSTTSRSMGGRMESVQDSAFDVRTGILYIRGDQGKMPAGTRISWRTDSPPEEKQ